MPQESLIAGLSGAGIFLASFGLFFLVGLWIGRRNSKNRTSRRDPKPGEWWRFVQDQKGPWPMEEIPPYKILDVRDGWVLYSMSPESQSSIFRNRLKISQFARMYEPATDYGALK